MMVSRSSRGFCGQWLALVLSLVLVLSVVLALPLALVLSFVLALSLVPEPSSGLCCH